jgi:hypothetical protein
MGEWRNGPVGCLAWMFGFAGGDGGREVNHEHSETGGLPYALRDDFLSPAEISFFHVLNYVFEDRVIICPNVRLADLFYTCRPNECAGFQSRISQKHIDVMLCDPKAC